MSVEAYQIGMVAGSLAVGFITGYLKGYRRNEYRDPEKCFPDPGWVCQGHSGLVTAISGLEERIDRIHHQLDNISQVQMEILRSLTRCEPKK